MARRTFVWFKRLGRAIADLASDYSFYFRPARRRQRAFIGQLLANSKPLPKTRLVVSLTTLPDRIRRLQATLESLLNQSCVPDEIILAIPEFSVRQKRNYEIPSYLTSMSRLRILRCEKDWGPATKFIATVQGELAAGRRDTLIMVVDDDRIYPPDSIELYRHYHAQLPDAALGFRGGAMPRTLDWRHNHIEFGVDLQQPKRIAVVTGCGSYLVQPRFFDASLWDYAGAPDGAFYMDDMWISGCLARRGIERYLIPASAMMRTALRQVGTMTLHDVPNGRYRHNNETIAFFGASWKVFIPD
jgi:hypothetical protein